MLSRTRIIGLAVGIVAAAPLCGMTHDQVPSPQPQPARLADPDEALDRLASKIDKANRDHRYDRSSPRSVMEFGTNNGSTVRAPH